MESEEITSFSSESLDDSDYNLNDVLTYLSDQLDRLGCQFRKYRHVDHNNLPSPDDKTLLKYELHYLTCLINLIQTEDPLPWWRFPAHILVDVKKILREDISSMNILFSCCKNRLEADKKDLLELENRLGKIEEMKKKLEEDTTSSLPVESVKSRRNKLDILFQKDKRRLNDVMDLFPDNLKNMLQTISTKYFSEDCGNPYISFENDAQFHELELLLESNIITRHPHDPKQIRLSNFLE